MSIEVDNRGNFFFSDRAYIQLRIPDDSEGLVTYSPEIGSRLLDLFKMHPLRAPFYWRETPRISQYYVFACRMLRVTQAFLRFLDHTHPHSEPEPPQQFLG